MRTINYADIAESMINNNGVSFVIMTKTRRVFDVITANLACEFHKQNVSIKRSFSTIRLENGSVVVLFNESDDIRVRGMMFDNVIIEERFNYQTPDVAFMILNPKKRENMFILNN